MALVLHVAFFACIIVLLSLSFVQPFAGVPYPCALKGSAVAIRSFRLPVSYRNAQPEDLRQTATLCTDVFEGPFQWYESLKRLGAIEKLYQQLNERHLRFVQRQLKHAMIVATDEAVKEGKGTIVGFLEIGLLPSPVNADVEDRSANISSLSAISRIDAPIAESPRKESKRSDVLYLGNVVVSEQYRRRGIASKLLKIAEKIAVKFQETCLYVAVENSNKEALQFYAARQFDVVLDESQLIGGRRNQQRIFLKKEISSTSSTTTSSASDDNGTI